MPSSMHPQAKFDPIPPNLDLEELVENTPNFKWAMRIPASRIYRLGREKFERLILLQVIQNGTPVVIEGWNQGTDQSLFSARWLETTYDKKEEPVRDIGQQADMRMTIGHYLRSMRQLTDQWTPSNFRDERRQRLYLKDIDCPPEWHDRLRKILPANLFYMNDNVEKSGGENSLDPFGETAIAPAGDLMSCLPEEMRAQNLMCYIGHEGTYTPAHREMCASLGQNIMVEASGGDDGEKPGSSIWFMTETKEREVVKEYFLSMLGHDIEIEKHFAQINAWKKATFTVHVVQQKPGDFILIPPLAPHQVWNRGTRTMKVAWNRTTVETLEMALHEALPKARLVCRDEQYKNKAIIYYALQKYYRDICSNEDADMDQLLGYGQGQASMRDSARSKQLMHDFKRLFHLFTEILVDEMFGTKENNVEYIEFDSNITCSYCRANIFNRFLTCKHCVRLLVTGDEDTYDVCMECYAMGRSCGCISKLTWCEQWNWSELVGNYDTWRTKIIVSDGLIDINTSPPPLEIARKRTGKKSVAQICQEQLRRRPFKDINKEEEPKPLEPPEIRVDAEGRPIKKKWTRKKKKGEVYRCHVCCHKDNTYKLAFCSNPGCQEAYCYGTLYRAFDMMPQEVMGTEKWKCPKCLNICNCGSCRRTNMTTPYVPKNTLLGHDTRRIADDRSTEALVDFRIHNLNWLKATGEESRSKDSGRMKRLKQQADAEKAKETPGAKDMEEPVPGAVDSNGVPQPIQVVDGYGDQSNVLGEGPSGYVPPNSGDHMDAQGGPEDMSFMGADQSAMADTSAYPDPSGLGEREQIFGLGYYEQEGPDKILFDDFEAPDADALNLDEEPEYFKKLRLHKRKARQEEDEDPDFRGPKSWRKKPKVDKDAASTAAAAAALYNAMVDPALLEGEDTTAANGAKNVTIGEAAVVAEPSDAAHAAQPVIIEVESEPYMPTLRHAKPMVSYAEPEEPPEEEFDEIVEPKKPITPANNYIADEGNIYENPIDLATRVMRSLTSQGEDADASLATQAVPEPRRRGLGHPKGKTPRVSKRLAATVAEAAPQKGPRKSRTSLLASKGLDRVPQPEDNTDSDSDIEAQLAAELEEADAREATAAATPDPARRRRGRAPKKRPSEGASTPAADELEDAGAREATTAAMSAPEPWRMGRPPKKRPSEGASTPAGAEPTPTRLLSMAERMALRGKKVKIVGKGTPRGRQSSTTASVSDEPPKTQTVVASIDISCAKFVTPAEEPSGSEKLTAEASSEDESEPISQVPIHRSSVSRAPAPVHMLAKSGPTIVRLGESDDDEDVVDFVDDDDDESISESGSDDDDDIPAVAPARGPGRPIATRGRGRPRGGRAKRAGRGGRGGLRA